MNEPISINKVLGYAEQSVASVIKTLGGNPLEEKNQCKIQENYLDARPAVMMFNDTFGIYYRPDTNDWALDIAITHYSFQSGYDVDVSEAVEVRRSPYELVNLVIVRYVDEMLSSSDVPEESSELDDEPARHL